MSNFLLVILASIVAIALFLFLAKLFNLPSEIKRKREIHKKEQRIVKLLDGQELKDILDASTYKYSWWQGENSCRIYDERVKNEFIGSASELEAKLWIVEKHLSAESTAKIFLYK